MSFGERFKTRRRELKLSRADLAERLGVSPSAISNYENGQSFPKEDVLLRVFSCLETEPNVLFQDSFRSSGQALSGPEQMLLRQYRSLSPLGRETVRSVLEALCAYHRGEVGADRTRKIPLYRTPAAAGYAAPVFGEDFDYIPVTDEVPRAAEFAVHISGDSVAPYIADVSVAYVTRDPLRTGDVGIFCVDGGMFCKQYFKDAAGIVHLFSLNRERADADVVLAPSDNRTMVCFGRVIMPPLPIPHNG